MKLAVALHEQSETKLKTYPGNRVYPSSRKASLILKKNNNLESKLNSVLNKTNTVILISDEFTDLTKKYSNPNLITFSNIFKIEENILEIIKNGNYEELLLISKSTYDLFYLLSIEGLKEEIEIKGIHTLCNQDEIKLTLSNLPDDCIYPCKIPTIGIPKNDQSQIFLIDTPARNLALMPNGFGYIHESLMRIGFDHFVIDFDIILYHWFQISRIIDFDGEISISDDLAFPSDPWKADHYDIWTDPKTVEYFRKQAATLAERVSFHNPKIIMMSLQQNNEAFSRIFIEEIKKNLKDTFITVGGFSCYNHEIGLRAFPDADYMFVGESDFSVDLLIPKLMLGEKPKNISGILSKFDDPSIPYKSQPLAHELDIIPFPKYEWYDLDTYRNWNGYQLTPVIASRGCRWARCTFCAERFYWRIRSAKNFVDELEWLVKQGCTLFMFNESDLNGAPERLLEICDELIARELKIRLTGQLRIHVKSDKKFFEKLKKAGFTSLRFGVDAFSDNAMKLQVKGYNSATVFQNLRDCWESGIYTEVNWVIGVPGETWDDVEEGIKLAIKCKPFIGRMANINSLMLLNGSVYWQNPDMFNIKFHQSKEELFKKYPRVVPSENWHSEKPYIDGAVRRKYFEHIVLKLSEEGFQFGEWAAEIVRKYKSGIDLADRVGQEG